MHAEAVGKIVFSFPKWQFAFAARFDYHDTPSDSARQAVETKKLLDPQGPSTPDAFGLVCGGMDKMGKMRYNIFVKLCVKM